MKRIELVMAIGTCPHCERTAKIVEEIAKRTGAELKVLDLLKAPEVEIEPYRKAYGVFAVPLVIIDGKKFSMGRTPSPEELEEALTG